MPTIFALSQKEAEKLTPEPNSALISITTPRLGDAYWRSPNLDAWVGRPILQLFFHDSDPEVHKGRHEEQEGVIHMTEEDARRILAFAKQHSELFDIYVHCWAGKSRSNAIARALSELFGFEPRSLPSFELMNRHVYQLLIKEGGRDGHN